LTVKYITDIDMIFTKSSCLMHLCNRSISNIRSISYVSRVREIQKIKEDKNYCEKLFGNTGNYLLYVKVSFLSNLCKINNFLT
jgi:hypothetical protein